MSLGHDLLNHPEGAVLAFQGSGEAVTTRVRRNTMSQSRAAYMRGYRARRSAIRSEGGLLPFQSSFVAAVCRKEQKVSIAALSTPRANGKSWLAGVLVARCLTPGDPLHEFGVENILVAASRPQAAIVLDFTRAFLADEEGYRWRLDGVEHLESRARVKVISSDSRRAMGLGAHVRLAICDEPGSWAPQSGRRLWESVTGAIGKRRMTVVAVGTLAPAPLVGPASWWPDLVKSGSGDARHVSLIQADAAKWESFDEVLRCNPVSSINPYLKQTLAREHKTALESDRAARTFRQFRLNLPGDPVESQPLITGSEWARVCARPLPEISGKPVIGVDLGGSRSWSAAAAIWPSGRIESWALAPGKPSLSDQEKEDQVAEGTYLELVRSGGLAVDEGRAVPSIERLLSRVWPWEPLAIVCDNYRAPELHQVVSGRVRVIERAKSGGEATGNIQALRARLLDSEAGVSESSRALLAAAWAQTNLIISNEGLTKVTKLDQRRSRDDASAALLLAAGEQARRPAPVELRGAVISKSREVTWLG